MGHAILAYKQMQDIDGSLDLTRRVLKSIEIYISELQHGELSDTQRYVTCTSVSLLVGELSNNIRPEISETEKITIIKICGQIIKNVNKFVNNQHPDLNKELAAVRLLYKLVS